MSLKYANNLIRIIILLMSGFFLSMPATTQVLADAECLTPAGTGCGVIDHNSAVGKYCIVNGYSCYFRQNQARACTAGDDDGDICCSGPDSTTQVNLCLALIPTPAPTLVPGITITPTSVPFTPYGPVTNTTFNAVNPLKIAGGDSIDETVPSQWANRLSTPGGIISRALEFIFPLAGLILFVLLVWGGFEMLVGSPTKKSMDAGRQRVTAAVAGFFLLFAAYWIWQILQIVFGVVIL